MSEEIILKKTYYRYGVKSKDIVGFSLFFLLGIFPLYIGSPLWKPGFRLDLLVVGSIALTIAVLGFPYYPKHITLTRKSLILAPSIFSKPKTYPLTTIESLLLSEDKLWFVRDDNYIPIEMAVFTREEIEQIKAFFKKKNIPIGSYNE
jgi:hypothetical protein